MQNLWKKKLDNGTEIKIVYLEVDTKDADPIGNEPVYYQNKIVGVVTSGGYGFRVKKSLAFAYIDAQIAKESKEFEIQILGSMRKAKILEEAAYDPYNNKLKS